MSTLTEQGVMDVKEQACDLLLASRVETKLKGKKMNDVINRLHLAIPNKRDAKERPPCIPEELKKKNMDEGGDKPKKKLERDLEVELAEDYILDLQSLFNCPLCDIDIYSSCLQRIMT